MGMANIHSIRKSFQSLRLLCTQMPDPGNWLSALESTKWLQHLSVLLKSALLVVHAVDRDQRPVLVHCSDGWDRTPQIVALAKLLLDPYYRTIEGFQVLVETEWLDFGHKFADRCGHGENSDDLNERCPVFLQWLDCVHQLQRQFPCSFEFNEAFLVKLVQHTYSCLFGTFLCNNAKERGEKHTQERTCSVWSLLRAGNKAFKNLLYSSQSESVLYPVCHVRNLMLWSAVYLPCSSPSTPADDTCAPYPVPGSNPEDQPLGRLPKTRSFDNLTTACDSSVPTTNRRSSDPSLNEKWQEHRRSLELSSLGNPGDDPFDGEALGRPGRTLVGAELSVAVAEGQMENILQEASTEEVSLEESERSKLETTGEEGEEDLSPDKESRTENLGSWADGVHQKAELDTDTRLDNPVSNQQVVSQGASELPGQADEPAALPSAAQKPSQVRGLQTDFVDSAGGGSVHRAENGSISRLSVEVGGSPGAPPPSPPSLVLPEAGAPHMESSTETLTENGAQLEPAQNAPCRWLQPADNSADELSQPVEGRHPREDSLELHKLAAGLNRTPASGSAHSPMPSPCALPLVECKEGVVCNGELEPENKVAEKPTGLGAPQKYPAPNGHCVNGEDGRIKGPLSRQVSAASSSSAPPHLRSHPHKWGHAVPGRQPTASSPDQPARSHLDDDGMPIYADVIQQRLRQIESGHQQEVETLKKQVQELRSRLESQYLNSSLRFNGDYGDEVTSIPDSESNLDQNCLSRCSTEIFSEASWEQVDKQDTEVTRWLPDHLAAHCYGCDSTFWLASRKHHCSCCNQKVPVPSQQLFEPSRVCKSCYSSLHPSSTSLDLELDKPITATSN
ncbi:hypothetical protein lerEdw1_019360 [Lerista edwardsae]|nr:hypothetical protein lerEdw1_019360 [Lerista edwardsae]